MGTTPNGLPFPEGTDPVRDGDNAIQSLALAVDHRDWTAEAAAGTVNANATANVAFTFPAGWFATPPIVLAGTRAASTCIATVGSATTSGVAATVRNVGTGAASPVVVIQAMRATVGA